MILTIIIGFIGLGLMVFIHELGHFVAAKINGVEVEVFSLGWGTKLIGFTRGGTTYQISWFPIGGYCKMKGEASLRVAQDGDLADVPMEKGSFPSAAPWRRIIIAAFGPLFNVIFAILVFALISWVGYRVFSPDNRIILATDYSLDGFPSPPPATVAGLKTGDRVVEIDGSPVEKFQDILEVVTQSSNRTMVFSVSRQEPGGPQNVRIPVTAMLDKATGAGRIGIYSWVDPVISRVSPRSPAAIAGLRAGDRIVRLDGREVRHSIDVSQALAGHPAKVIVDFQRAGALESVPLVLTYDGKNPPELGIEFAVAAYRSPRVGPGGALATSVRETVNTVVLTVKGIGLLFQGVNLRSAVAGPLRITYYIGTAATSGFQLGVGQGVVSFFRFLSFLSVALFLMNLLPIPAVDGGQILLFLIEMARRKPVRPRLVGRIQFVGFSVLIVLVLLITFSDILFFMGR
jgi:regulator of sigma E protease